MIIETIMKILLVLYVRCLKSLEFAKNLSACLEKKSATEMILVVAYYGVYKLPNLQLVSLHV